MVVSLKTVIRIMDEIEKMEKLDGDSLEYATDIEQENRYIIRAYDPNTNKTLYVYISKPKNRYTYEYKFVDGENFNQY